MKQLAAIFFVLVLAGCAAPQPKTLVFDNQGIADNRQALFPGNSEVPRYLYIGEITGEKNFELHKSDADKESGFTKFFRWLIGLGRSFERPMELSRPQGTTVDGEGRIYITDVGDSAVFKFDRVSGELFRFIRATGGKSFVAPVGIALFQNSEIHVADAELGAIFRLDLDGNPLGQYGAGDLERPTGIAIDSERGEIYVSDTRKNAILVFDRHFTLMRAMSSGGNDEGELHAPTYLAFKNDTLYVSDTLNCRIQLFDHKGQFVRAFGKRGMNLGEFTRPKGVGADSEGNIYVIESYFDHLLVYNSEGRFMLPIGGYGTGPGKFFLPAGLWVDEHDRIYVADLMNSRVVVYQFLGGG